MLAAIPTKGIEIYPSEGGEANLKECRFGAPRFFYDPASILAQHKAWWESLMQNQPKVIFIFGLGLGHLFKEAEHWLATAQDHYLVFLEPDPAVLKRFLEMPDAGKLLAHPQVRIEFVEFHPNQQHNAVELCIRLSNAFFGLPYALSCLDYYSRYASPMYAWFSETFLSILRNAQYHVIAHLFMAERNYSNIYRNLFQLSSAVYAQSLIGGCKDIPAIIVGAGPSIQKNIEVLKEVQERALLFSGGASITLLGNHGMVPDLCAAVDPDPPFDRFAAHKAFETPLLFQTRTSSEILSLFHGPKIYLPPSGGIPLESWFSEQLNLYPGTFGSVLTVSDVCTQVAALLGCDPIILVGMDLCFTSGQYYASSVSKSEDFTKGKDQIAATDITGQPVFTKSEWMLSAQQIGSIAKKFHAQKFINATEGGLGFEGIPNIPLREVKETFLKKEVDTKGRIRMLLQNGTPVQASPKDIEKLTKQLHMSLQRMIFHCASWQDTLKLWMKEPEKEPPYLEDFFEKTITAELAYKVIVQPLWEIFRSITERNIAEASRGKTPWQQRLLREMHRLKFYKKTAAEHHQLLSQRVF